MDSSVWQNWPSLSLNCCADYPHMISLSIINILFVCHCDRVNKLYKIVPANMTT